MTQEDKDAIIGWCNKYAGDEPRHNKYTIDLSQRIYWAITVDFTKQPWKQYLDDDLSEYDDEELQSIAQEAAREHASLDDALDGSRLTFDGMRIERAE